MDEIKNLLHGRNRMEEQREEKADVADTPPDVNNQRSGLDEPEPIQSQADVLSADGVHFGSSAQSEAQVDTILGE